ncbi:MAG: hypothetical protein IJ088_12130 [Clostridia bacterium]|nr:hypothetical protein [Clostridia bacterium]
MAITVPEPGLKEKNDAELRQHLNEMKASMTPEDISALVERTKAYHAFVEESSQIVMPDSLNALTVSSLPEEVPHKVASETTLGGIRLVTSEVDSPLIRIALINNAAVIPFEDLLDYMEFTSLLGQLGTDLYSRVELPSKFSLTTTGVSLMDSDAFEILKTHEVKFKAETHWFTLPDLLEDSFALIEHILYHTDFSDYDFIRNDAARRVANYTNSLSDSSLNIGLNAAMFPFSDSVKINHYLNGYEFIRYLDKVSKMSDSELDALTAKFEHFRDLVLNRNGAVLAIMGNGENILRASALGYHLISKFDDAEHETLDYAALIPDTPRNLAIVTGGNVVYNLVMTNLEEAGFDRTDGGLDIIEGLLDDKLLYPELRVKNSAYGGYSLKEAYILGLYSYRDPKVTETYQIYGQAADFLRNLSISEKELEGYQISAYSYVNPPAGPLSIALTGIMDQIYHRETVAEKIRTIRDIKAFTPADIARYGALLDRFGTDESTRVTAGSKSLIESAPDLFSRISYDLINFTGEDAGE